MSNPKIQGEVEFNTTQAEAALGRVEERGEKMASSLVKSGDKAGKSTAAIGDGAAASAEKFTRAESQIAASIQRRTALLASAGQGERAYAEARIKAAGLDVSKFSPALAALDDAEKKTKQVTNGLNTMGLSAKQFSANMRGVPAQFTDIITSLQGGQRPLTVLMQQGGQLKDMFGGVGNAAKALGGYVLGLVNPFTLTVSAVAAMGLAFYQGRNEIEAYNKSLILTGNAAGTSAGQLTDTAKRIKSETGATVGAISETLNEIAASGKVSSDVIEKVAKAAVEMEKVGGAAASATVKEFASLGDAPVAAILKLNEKYHFLTESVYSQIKALEDQGRVTDAAKLAQTTYADAIEGRIPSLNENLGLLEKAWRGVSGAAKSAWDSMVDVGREKSLDQQLQEAISKKNGEIDYSAGEFGKGARIAVPGQEKKIQTLSAEIESRDRQQRMSAADQRIQDEAIASKKSLDVLTKGLRSKEVQIKESNEKIAREAAAVNAATPGSFNDKQISDLQKAAADKITGKEKSTAPVVKSQLSYDLAEIKKASEEQIGAYSNAEKTMQAMRAANLIEEGDYYEAKAGFIRLNSAVKEDELEKELARMRQEKLSGKDKIDNDKKILETESKLAKLRADTTANLTVNSIQQQGALDKITQAYADAKASAESYLATIARQNERKVAGIGQGGDYRSEQSARNQIEDKLTTKKTSLDDDKRRGQITQETYDTYLKIAEDTYNKELAMHSDTRDKILGKQADWTAGMSEALANYADSAKNVAEQTADLFTNAFKGMEDAFVKFVQTGKIDFKSLADSMIADYARMQAKALISSATSGGGIFSLISGLFGGSSSSSINTGAGSGFNSALWGQRAGGGSVLAGGKYQVNENGPELLSSGGKDYLMMGNKGGMVTPNNRLGGGISVTSAPVITIDSRTDQAQVKALVDRAVRDGNAQLIQDLQEAGAL